MTDITKYAKIREFNAEDRFMSLDVFRSDFTGIGRTHGNMNTIYIPHPEGYLKFKDLEEREPMAIFIPKNTGVGGRDHWALVPWLKPIGVIGPMSDGNLAYSCDSRITRVYHIHDRFETTEMYNALST